MASPAQPDYQCNCCPLCRTYSGGSHNLRQHVEQAHTDPTTHRVHCNVAGCTRSFPTDRPDAVRDHLREGHDVYAPGDPRERSLDPRYLGRKSRLVLRDKLHRESDALALKKARLIATEHQILMYDRTFVSSHSLPSRRPAVDTSVRTKVDLAQRIVEVRQDLYLDWEGPQRATDEALREAKKRHQAHVKYSV